MNVLSPLRYRSLLALLLLCLSWTAWVEAEHIHLHGDGVAEECLVYHHGAAAALSSGGLPSISLGNTQASTVYFLCATKAVTVYSQPVRGPPTHLS